MPGRHIANGANPKDSLSAFVFDVDGVFIRGEKVIPGARETIRLLQRRNDPFIFLTNGGGHTEQTRVEKLGQRLGLTLDAKQFVQSHTPYYDLVSEYGDKTVLVLGAHGDQIRDLAHKYGFKKVLTSSDIMAERPLIHPFPEMTKAHHEKYGRNNNVRSSPIFCYRPAALSARNRPRTAILLCLTTGTSRTTSPSYSSATRISYGAPSTTSPGSRKARRWRRSRASGRR